MKQKISLFAAFILPLCFYFSIPFHWLPEPVKKQHYQWFGLPSYQSLPSETNKSNEEFEIEDASEEKIIYAAVH